MQKQTAGLHRLLIVPDHSSPEARICTLSHPRTSRPSHFFFDPSKGVCEFTKVAAQRSACRSWLLGRGIQLILETREGENACERDLLSTLSQPSVKERPILSPQEKAFLDSESMSEGYILRDAEILVATPIDYLFLLLPSLINSKGLFLSSDDFSEKLSDMSKHWDDIISHPSARNAMEERIQAVCDCVDAGDEKMYRLNEKRLLDELLRKADNVVAIGLPPVWKKTLFAGS